LEIEEITSADDFDALRQEWNRLVDGITDNTLFLCWERMAPAVTHLEKESALKLICIKDGGEILGLVPLKKLCRSVGGGVGYTVIETISERTPGILLKDRKSDCLEKLMAYLYGQKDWDFLYFRNVPETFSVVNLLQHSTYDFNMIEEDVSPYIQIPDSMPALYEYFSASWRYYLRRNLRKLEQAYGKIELKDYFELGSLEEMMGKCFELHQARWESKGQPGVFYSKRHRDIFLHEAKLFSEIDCLKLRFLLAGGKPISVFYGYEHNRTLYYLLSGFDPNYESFGPSNLEVLKTLERCIEDGVEELNFFSGFTSYKFKWCKNFRRNYTFKFVNNKVYSRALTLINNINKRYVRAAL
jgi:CelD/BcsL family acetyltransferase involved in cellulose biosynthesis